MSVFVRVLVFSAAAIVAAAPMHAQSRYFSERNLQGAVDALNAVDLKGRHWTAADLRGRIVLIDFWASWCAPCLEQIPELQRLRQVYGPQRFEVLAISLDSFSRRALVSWLNRQGVDWPQVHDGRAFNSPAARRFGVRVLPASLLVVDGRIAAQNLRGPRLADAVGYFASTSSFDAARVPIVIR